MKNTKALMKTLGLLVLCLSTILWLSACRSADEHSTSEHPTSEHPTKEHPEHPTTNAPAKQP